MKMMKMKNNNDVDDDDEHDNDYVDVEDNETENVEDYVDDKNSNENDTAAEMDARYGPRLHEHGLRPRRPCNYRHMMTGVGYETTLQETMMTHYSMKKGIKTFGEPAIATVL
jgi:hypothetical protein